MEIVVEILEQGQRKSRIERIDVETFSIGRSWNADIIIQDPEIDAEHLWIDLKLASLSKDLLQPFYIKDCNTVNGTKIGKQSATSDQAINWGEWITIGSTRLCLHSVMSPLPEAKRRKPIDSLVARLQIGWVALGLMVLAILNSQYSAHLNRPVIFSWENSIDTIVQILFSLLTWAVIWGSITRLTKQQFQIWLHLSLASIVLISFSILSEIAAILTFNSLSTFWQRWSPTLLSLFIGISWLLFALYVGTSLKAKKRLGITATLVFFYLLTTQILPQMRADNWVAVPQMTTIARPATFLITPESTQESYINNIDKAFERAREKTFEINE